MSDNSIETRIAAAQAAAEAAGALVGRIARGLYDACAVDGRLSGAALDERQVISLELAEAAAQVEATRQGLAWAVEVRAKGKGITTDGGALLEERIALYYAATATRDLLGRVRLREADFGLTAADVDETVGAADVLAFVTAEAATRQVEALGAVVRDLDGKTGARLLNQDQDLMRTTFRDFADGVVAPLAEEVHRDDRIIPKEILDPLLELGAFGLSVPERFGGFQSDEHEDNMGMIVVTEELSRASLGAAGSLITRPEIVAKAILKGGTDAQKERWLPAIALGDPLPGVAITEPDYGSDVAQMKCKAVKVDGGWQLDGAKSWLTMGGKAGLLLVLARTDIDSSKGHKGLSLFLVEKPSSDGHEFAHDQPAGGRISGKATATIGYRGMHSFDVWFDEYLVPDEALLGGEGGLGKGFYYLMDGFAGGRIQTAARALGVLQAAFDKAVTYTSERKVFGKTLDQYPLTLAKLGRMATLVAVSRVFTYGVAKMMDTGEGRMEASLVKFFTGKTAEWVSREAMQLHGGMGYAEESDVSRYFLDARVLSIFEGAEEVLGLKVIARSLIAEAGTV